MQPLSKMAVMKPLLVIFCISAICLRAVNSAYRYNINEYLDNAVKEFNMKVVNVGDEHVTLGESLAVGGFVLTLPILADMSTLERVQDAWLQPLQDGVEIEAIFKFGKMQLDGLNLTGPGKNVYKPRISSRVNRVEVTFKVQLESVWNGNVQRLTKHCSATNDATLTSLFSVVLVTRDGATLLDSWIDGLFRQIAEQLNPFLRSLFAKHFDVCRSLESNGYKWSSNV